MFSTRANTTRADKRERAALANDARQSEKQEAIPGLPQEVVITHILRSENLADPTDLARLRAVSRGMCEAVTATGREIKEMIQQEAAQHGCLSTLIHLFRRGRLFRKKICETAARFGQLETLRWARAKGCPWGARTCAFAAEGGHLEVLQWADEKRCPWDERTCKYAAMGGHLEVLQWARENGCPWNKQTCHNAVKCGHLEVLQWARANDCQCDRFTCAWAAMVDIARYCSGCVRTAARGTGIRA